MKKVIVVVKLIIALSSLLVLPLVEVAQDSFC